MSQNESCTSHECMRRCVVVGDINSNPCHECRCCSTLAVRCDTQVEILQECTCLHCIIHYSFSEAAIFLRRFVSQQFCRRIFVHKWSDGSVVREPDPYLWVNRPNLGWTRTAHFLCVFAWSVSFMIIFGNGYHFVVSFSFDRQRSEGRIVTQSR